MKKFNSIILIFIAVLFSAQSFPQVVQPWQKLSSPTPNFLTQLFFVDSLTGWACGFEGTIIYTSDGGENWILQNSNLSTTLRDIFFLNKDLGWSLSWTNDSPFRTIILKTTNGGSDWLHEFYNEDNILFNSIYFVDSLTGFMGGPPIAKTTDGGLSWRDKYLYDLDTLPPDISQLPINTFRFHDPQYGFTSGGWNDFAGVMWRTSDYGETWGARATATDPILDFNILDSSTIIGLAGDPEGLYGIGLIRSSDAGISWAYEELPILGTVSGMSFRTPSEGWAASGDKFIFTQDSGFTWNEFPIPEDSYIFDLTFTDSLTGYAVGYEGVILKYFPPTVDVQTASFPALDFSLFQNYPNPFNPATNLKFRISNFEFVTLKVYDILGNEIAVLVNEEKPPGVYEAVFNAASLSSGMYFYRLTAGNFSETKKMILLK